MICTFGDTADVPWWRDLPLDTRPVLGPDGRFMACPPPGITGRDGRAAYQELAGATSKAAGHRINALLQASGYLLPDAEPLTLPVKCYEMGDRPLEHISTRLWVM